MKTVVGTFPSRLDAEKAMHMLQSAGFARESINLLLPGSNQGQLLSVPTTEGEQPGMGKALGAVVGGALGAAAGVALPTMASLLVPGVGPVLAVGTAAAALLGLGGAMGGAVAGGALEDSLSEGLPKDELYVYADALRRGRCVIIAVVEDDAEVEAARDALAKAGAESLDAARESWWVGLREEEHEEYARQGRDFPSDEAIFRKGFEAALHPSSGKKSFDEMVAALRERHGEAAAEEAFKRGFERGRHYYQTFLEETRNL